MSATPRLERLTSVDTRKGETILGFYLRAGAWIDGLEILTSIGRRSGVFGNASGGSGYVFQLFYYVYKLIVADTL